MLNLVVPFVAGMLVIPLIRVGMNIWYDSQLDDLPTADAMRRLLEKHTSELRDEET